MAPKGRLLMCLDRLDRQNCSKGCRRARVSAHSSITDPLPSFLKSSVFQFLLWLGPQNVTGRRLGLPNCTRPRIFAALVAQTDRSADLEKLRSAKNGQISGQHLKFVLWSSLDIEEPRDNQRVDKLYDRSLDAQISQKVRCTMCSQSTKRSLPRRSGRSPLGLRMC